MANKIRIDGQILNVEVALRLNDACVSSRSIFICAITKLFSASLAEEVLRVPRVVKGRDALVQYQSIVYSFTHFLIRGARCDISRVEMHYPI